MSNPNGKFLLYMYSYYGGIEYPILTILPLAGGISTLRVNFPTLFRKVANYTLLSRVGSISTLECIFHTPISSPFYSVCVFATCSEQK